MRTRLNQLLDAARRMHARWQQRQRANATYTALNRLDTRTLRDIGLDRSELLSVAAEIAGKAKPTRQRSFS